MLRKYLLLTTILVVISGLFGCSPAAVTFPDANLEAVVREALEKPDGPIHASELEGMVSFSAPQGRKIADLTGLQHCTNLTELDLGGNEIGDISPLASLTNLTELDLSENQIENVSPLASLTSLIKLNLAGNPVRDVSPLASLTKLKIDLGCDR